MRVFDRTAVGLRRAAWEIAELGEPDRAWLLSQLSERERHQLSQLVAEATLVEPDKADISVSEDSGGTDLVTQLPFSLAVLAQMPDWLAGRALLCVAADLRTRLLNELPWSRRRRLRKALETEQAGRGVTDSTSAALLECLRTVSFGVAVKS